MIRRLRQNILAGNGEAYTLRVAAVRSKSANGAPRTIELISMDEKIDVTKPENREFVTVYVPKHVIEPRGE